LGRIGWNAHVPGVANQEGLELAAVCDPMPGRVDEAREKYGARGYTDYEEMIAAEKPDLVVLASPTHLHPPQAIHAMERGCDVFTDKPIARDLAETDAILEVQARTGRKLMLYQPLRLGAEIQALKAVIDSGVLGKLFMLKKSSSRFVRRDDWQAFKKYGGGMLNNYGAHSIDSALYLLQSHAVRVSGHMHCIASAGDADDVVRLLFDTASGVTVDIDINMASALPEPGTIVYGQYGTAVMAWDKERVLYRARYFDPADFAATAGNEDLAATGRKYPAGEPSNWQEREFTAESGIMGYYQKVYDHFALDAEPFVPLSDTREVMRIMEECRKSAGWEV
jgi:predicted dehydrogenase